MDPQYMAALQDGATLVTANKRLSRALVRRFDMAQTAAGRAAWRSPDILPLGAWLRRCFEEQVQRHGDPRLLLGDQQRRLVWERLIEDTPATAALLNSSGLAETALAAWRLTHQWRASMHGGGTAEHQAFHTWAAAYQARGADEQWLDPDVLPDEPAAWLASGVWRPPAQMLFAGFDEWTPQLAALRAALRAAGCNLSDMAFPSTPGQAVRASFADAQAEREAAARWARALLEVQPEASVALVVPQLTAQRADLQRTLEDVLNPGFALAPDDAPSPLFNMSEGLPLGAWPLAHAALAMLGLGLHPLSLQRIAEVLHSPFLGDGEAEADARALLDVRLRRHGELHLSLGALRRWAQGVPEAPRAAHHCPRLADLLGAWTRVTEAQPARRRPGAWAKDCAERLAALGFPGERSLSSAEHQTHLAWQSALVAFAALDVVEGPLTYAQALARLQQVVADTTFQPEARDAPLQVLGVLEAGGLQADHTWVLGLHDEDWPPPLRPNPFLPLALQRRLGMPHADASRELARHEAITRRLLTSAPRVVLSHALRENDRDLRHSPLIRDVPVYDPDGLPRAATEALWSVMQRAAAPVETLPDETAPELSAARRAVGGTAVFRDQAACPFRAFATHRLHAVALEEPAGGLSPRDQGNLLHDVMHAVWSELGSQEALLALPPAALAELVQRHADATVAELAVLRPTLLPSRLQATEGRRLVLLVQDELAVEKLRPPFRVQETESNHAVTVGGLTVNTRIDRVDELRGGGNVVLDYKTGRSTSTGAWFGERPDEPQLPLYCSSGDFDVRGALFSRVVRGDVRLLGYLDSADEAPQPKGIAPFAQAKNPRTGDPFGSREAVLDTWHGVLEQLAAGFRSGMARVDPKHPRATCTICPLPALCRIGVLDGDDSIAEADGEAEP